MIVGVLSYKGGVGKTTTAVHLAAYMNRKKPALLIDGDLNRSALAWSRRGELPFKTVDEKAAAKFSRDFEHVVIDTGARPDQSDLEAMAEGCDDIVVATGCDALSLDAILPAIEALRKLGAQRYRVLLTFIPPVGRAGADAREALTQAGLPLFKGGIRRYAAFGKAALEGMTVDRVNDPHAADGWADYQAIGKELMK
jgi:chromosome partitioning protein